MDVNPGHGAGETMQKPQGKRLSLGTRSCGGSSPLAVTPLTFSARAVYDRFKSGEPGPGPTPGTRFQWGGRPGSRASSSMCVRPIEHRKIVTLHK